MARQIYSSYRFTSFGPFEYEADFSDPSSPISVRFPHLDTDEMWTDEDGWQAFPYQVADAGSRAKAEKLIVEYFK
jgi:hypothetical protein